MSPAWPCPWASSWSYREHWPWCACWVAVRRLFGHAGTAAELSAMGAREPRSTDLEEHQLVNVVAEIAIAAGLSPPGVYVIDSSVANAAVTGASAGDAPVVVSRGLLDGLGRDETQGVIAHLVGRVGNGDLAIARTMASLYYTLGLWWNLLRQGRVRAGYARQTAEQHGGHVGSPTPQA